jgi:molybdate transport system substrate-binding protein
VRTKSIARNLRLFMLLIAIPSIQLVAQTVKVMSSGGLAPAFTLLSPQYEKATGTHVETAWGPSMGTTTGAIPVRLARGEAADVLIMVRTALDDMVKKGWVIPGSEVDLAVSKVGMAVKAGAPVPDISTVEAFRKTLLQARSVAYSDSASGVYLQNELFKRLGIEKEMAPKSHMIPATPVGEILVKGDAEIGFQQLSELKAVPGVTIVGPIPEEVQLITYYSAGIVAKGPNQDGGRALIRFLASPTSCDAIRKTGVDPIACATGKPPMSQPSH